MATTYCENTDLYLDNGQSVDDFMISDLSESGKTTRKDAARERAYNKINDVYLRGRTAIPANHIAGLQEMEIDLVISDILFGAFTGGVANVSEWAEEYKRRAEDALKNIRFNSSVDSASADGENIGDGTVTITTNDRYTQNEKWILTAMSDLRFTVHGSMHGYLPGQVTVGTQFPEKNFVFGSDYGTKKPSLRFEEFPISLLITVGSIAFVQNDKFTFDSYAASYYHQIMGSITRG